MMPMLESAMEELLIRQLACDVSQWTYRPDIRTEDDLWQNLREKLNAANIDRLQGVLLTDTEMAQVKDFICDQAQTTYKAARWLAGEHRVAQIPLTREDAKLGTVSLVAVNSREIAGGNSVYEVINQYRTSGDTGERDRRFDVTLLVNGLPMIHIELKNVDHPYMDAYRQIKKYGEEGKFRGLMGLVQMFVMTNGAETRYIAADNRGNLNEKFLTRWVNEKNEAVDDYLAFAKAALNIPLAHQMIGRYSVLDNERKKVILLRPYQIHAIEAIRQASRDRRSGFVWHTTGSGKTLTSYTVTKNLLDIPSVDKTIFLIDRKDLDQQTSSSFMSYADSDDVDVQNTDRTADLEAKLKNRDRCAIVTTIQKLQTIIRRCTDTDAPEKYRTLAEKLREKNIAFVVDECHRAVTPETKRAIEKFFSRSLWYGFTGTPIFDVNKRVQKGDLARTTEALYGKCLHAYTIKEAIADKAVLGFQIQGMGFNRDWYEATAVKLKLFTEETVGDVETEELETRVNRKLPDLYDSDDYRQRVIDYIVNQSASKLHLKAPTGEAYEGLLTVPSIDVAQRYYRLFKVFKAEGGVSEKIRRLLPDFPKVAITYTVGENEDGATADQKEMELALTDYNAMFGTSWDMATLAGYNADLNDRLARKKTKYRNRDEQLDLVIVVDRLLTGFDAPCLSTIFLDRPPMKPQHLIQAFSRTNRLYDRTKRFGQIVTMRTPASYEKAINDALVLYSNGSTGDVAAPSWAETQEKCQGAVKKLRSLMPNPAAIADLTTLAALQAYAKIFQAVDRLLSEAEVYDEFDETRIREMLGITREEFNEHLGHYQNVLERIKALKHKGGTEAEDPVTIDVEYELESVKQMEVNFRYLVALIQAHMPQADDAASAVSDKEDARISQYIEDYKKANPKVGAVLSGLWSELKLSPEDFRDRDAYDVIDRRVQTVLEKEIRDFAATWCVNASALKAFAAATPATDVTPEGVNADMGNYSGYKAAGGTLSKLRYLRELRNAVATFVRDEVKPLMKF